jgi:hypothetical protein
MVQNDSRDYVELLVRPFSYQDTATIKDQFEKEVRAALRESEQEKLLDEGQISVEIQQDFAMEGVVLVGLTFLSQIAVETYKQIILPKLRKRFSLEEAESEEEDKNVSEDKSEK